MNAGGCGSFDQCHIRIFIVPQIFSTVVVVVLEIGPIFKPPTDTRDAVRDGDRSQAAGETLE